MTRRGVVVGLVPAHLEKFAGALPSDRDARAKPAHENVKKTPATP